MAMSSTCRMLLSAKAPTRLSGMMCRMNSTVDWCAARSAFWATAVESPTAPLNP
jgi:hypothetical protein